MKGYTYCPSSKSEATVATNVSSPDSPSPGQNTRAKDPEGTSNVFLVWHSSAPKHSSRYTQRAKGEPAMSDAAQLVLVLGDGCAASARAGHALRQFGGALGGVPTTSVVAGDPASAAAAFAARTSLAFPLLVALRGDRAVGTFSGPFDAVPLLRFALAAFARGAERPAIRARSHTV